MPERGLTPEKKAARSAIYFAKKAGLWHPQPCKVCGTTERIVGHHEDYKRPLDVVWLCQKHHIQRHDEINLSRCGYARPNMPKRNWRTTSKQRAGAAA